MTKIKSILFICFIAGSSLVYGECQKGRVEILVLGSGGPELTDGRASTSYLIRLDGKAIGLIDAGSGSSSNFEKSGAQLNDLLFIAFTHFHVDHSADFPAFIKAFYFSHRDHDLKVFGPLGNKLMPSATEFVQRVLGSKGIYPYLNTYLAPTENSRYKVVAANVSLQDHHVQKVNQTKDYSLLAVPVHHGPLPALAWRINLAGCSVTFSGDMSNHYQTLTALAKNSDILVAHHAIPEGQQGVARKLHMPPSEIGRIAQQANVKKLVLSHRMNRTLGREKESMEIIKRLYKGPVLFAEDLLVIAVNP